MEDGTETESVIYTVVSYDVIKEGDWQLSIDSRDSYCWAGRGRK